MDESRKQTVATDSLVKANSYLKVQDWPRAFAHFLVIFELYPDQKRNFEVEFEDVLNNLRLRLEDQNRIENIFNCYVQAIRHFPTNVRMLNDFASYWLRYELKRKFINHSLIIFNVILEQINQSLPYSI